MRICLISAATVTDFGAEADNKRIREIAEHPPLGVLTLAAILRERLATPDVLDLNRLYYEYLADSPLEQDFCAYAASRVPAGMDVIGLSTICSSYPLTLRLAKRLKRDHPEACIVLGGPQASVVDLPTLTEFPCVDIIVRGEADETLLTLLQTGVRSSALALVPGISYRNGKRIVRNPDAPLVANLDALPFPAFDLLHGIDELPYLSLELGRGCPFSCTFCSTNDFFRRRFRLKSPEVVLDQMRTAKRDYGATSFDLVHDMFTVDRKRVVGFCNTMLDSGERFQWGCSARTDCVDDDLIDLMYRAGCRGMFFGIETGSARLQRIIEKDLDLQQAAARIARATDTGLETTVSLITGFPEETEEDLHETLIFLMNAARHERVDPQLHILAPLAGTPLHNKYRHALVADDVYSDMSHQGWRQDVQDKELIAAFPDIFPNFYGLPAGLDRMRLKRLRDFVMYSLKSFRWVLTALHQSCGGIEQVFDAWEQVFPPVAMEERERYYASREFLRDFACFVRSRYHSGPEIDALLNLEGAVASIRLDGNTGMPANLPDRISLDAVPLLRPEVRVLCFEVDIGAIIGRLRRGEGLQAVAIRKVMVATRTRQPAGTDILELTPLTASFLKLCDGRNLGGVAAELKLEGISECAVIFQELHRQRLLTYRAPA